MLKNTPLLFPGLSFVSHGETNLCLCLLTPPPSSSSRVRRITLVLKWFDPSRLGRRSRVTMVPAFLEKATKCVNAAPVRGVSILWADGVFITAFVVEDIKILHFVIFRNGEGHFKNRGKQPQCEETKDPVGQKYRLRERYLRHHREKGPTRPTIPGIHSGIFKGNFLKNNLFSKQLLIIIKSNYWGVKQLI